MSKVGFEYLQNMLKRPLLCLILLFSVAQMSFLWGFFGHQKINRLAVFTLPSAMAGFYKKNIDYLTEASVLPDRRRFSVPEEGPRHYIDLEEYGDSAEFKLPRFWKEAVEKIGADSLQARGIVPWHIYREYIQLREAFLLNDPSKILKRSADLGHYIADAHVPLHTTQNHDGQYTDQAGIHALWESRLPELNFNDYDFFVGQAEYVNNVQLKAWETVIMTHQLVDSVLQIEKQLYKEKGDVKFNFETKGKLTVKVVSERYAQYYHQRLHGMVEQQMRASIKMIGDVWYTAWVDSGQPDLKRMIDYKPTAEELALRMEELKQWKQTGNVKARLHEGVDDQ